MVKYNGACVPCATGCFGCLEEDISACTSCQTGYYPSKDETGVTRCSMCFENCKSCSSATTCNVCDEGYLPSSDKKTCDVKCDDNCYTCDTANATLCKSCYLGAKLNPETNACDADLGCNETATCTSCSNGFVISAKRCYKCETTDSKCTACQAKDLSKCTKCTVGFYLKKNKC